jgi:hypothetical protein
MWTLFIIFGLMPVLVFIKLTAQRWHFRNGAEKIDMENELYQQLLKSARARSREKVDAEWELYRQRYD